MSDRRTHAADLCIAADHPTLPGHFPGRPIVPGVLLLDCVLAEAQRWLGTPLTLSALPHAKFVAPLLPSEQAQMKLALEGDELRFEIARGDTTLASGAFKVAPRWVS
jgi:3-hydroxyacyl-[acyl-carrier-protein] dehydratase